MDHLTATAQDQAYDETFTSPGTTAVLHVDSTPPALQVACPGAANTDPALAVRWGATDASPIAGYDVDVAIDGGASSPWLRGTSGTAATYSGLPGHSYSFSVRATDGLGNVSAPVSCGWASIAAPTPIVPSPPTVGRSLPSPARLRVSRTSLGRTTLAASGTLARDATGVVRASYSARGSTVRTSARVSHGRYRVTLHLSRALRRAPRGVLRISYGGDSRHAAQRIVASRPALTTRQTGAVAPLRIGTRGSALALAQTGLVADALGAEVEIVEIRTSGDEGKGRPAAPVGDKSRFVKEIEEALLAGEIDLAVHSAKDVPGELPAGLAIVAVPGAGRRA